jgi:hypothetical protein
MRTLIDLLVEAIKWDSDPRRLLLVPLSGRLRTASGRDAVPAIQGNTFLIPRIDAGSCPAELRGSGLGMRSMLAVEAGRRPADGELACRPIAVVDGWRILGHAAATDLSLADLTGADLELASMRGCNLRRATLCGANLSRADLSRADLSGADLRGAKLARTDLTGADLSYADCRRVDAKEALLTELVTDGSIWRGTDVWSAKLADTEFDAAFVEGFDRDRGDHRGAESRREKAQPVRV